MNGTTRDKPSATFYTRARMWKVPERLSRLVPAALEPGSPYRAPLSLSLGSGHRTPSLAVAYVLSQQVRRARKSVSNRTLATVGATPSRAGDVLHPLSSGSESATPRDKTSPVRACLTPLRDGGIHHA